MQLARPPPISNKENPYSRVKTNRETDGRADRRCGPYCRPSLEIAYVQQGGLEGNAWLPTVNASRQTARALHRITRTRMFCLRLECNLLCYFLPRATAAEIPIRLPRARPSGRSSVVGVCRCLNSLRLSIACSLQQACSQASTLNPSASVWQQQCSSARSSSLSMSYPSCSPSRSSSSSSSSNPFPCPCPGLGISTTLSSRSSLLLLEVGSSAPHIELDRARPLQPLDVHDRQQTASPHHRSQRLSRVLMVYARPQSVWKRSRAAAAAYPCPILAAVPRAAAAVPRAAAAALPIHFFLLLATGRGKGQRAKISFCLR